MLDFKKLKKASGNVDRLSKEIEKLSKGSERTEDTRFWQPEVDKSGNGQAVIRFLPAPAVDGEDGMPWVRLFTHGFQGPVSKKWYIENSLTTLNKQDPVSDYNSELWKQSDDDNSWQRKQVRAQKRKLVYISNIMVISDNKNPDNNGKVFLFRYGKKIFDKISALMAPEFEGDTPVNPFDFWKGADFKLRIKQVDGYRNYDSSVFESPSTIAVGGKTLPDEEIEKIWNAEYSLQEFLDPKNFKSESELRRRLNEVLLLGEYAKKAPDDVADDEEDDVPFEVEEKPKAPAKTTIKQVKKPEPVEDTGDEDEEMKKFLALANE